MGRFPTLCIAAVLFAAFTPTGLVPTVSAAAGGGPAKESKARDQELPAKSKMAVKLAGLVSFVASSCPELQPDYSRFKAAIGALGVSTADLERTEMKSTYLFYALRYKEDSANNCAKAMKDFGPSGSVIADLVKPRKQ